MLTFVLLVLYFIVFVIALRSTAGLWKVPPRSKFDVRVGSREENGTET